MAKTTTPSEFSSGVKVFQGQRSERNNLTNWAYTLHRIKSVDLQREQQAQIEIAKLLDVSLETVKGKDRERLMEKIESMQSKAVEYMAANEKTTGRSAYLTAPQRTELQNTKAEIKNYVARWEEWDQFVKKTTIDLYLNGDKYKDLDIEKSLVNLGEIQDIGDFEKRYEATMTGEWAVQKPRLITETQRANIIKNLPLSATPEDVASLVESVDEMQTLYKSKGSPPMEEFHKFLMAQRKLYESTAPGQKEKADLGNAYLRSQKLRIEINEKQSGSDKDDKFKLGEFTDGYKVGSVSTDKGFSVQGTGQTSPKIQLGGNDVEVTNAETGQKERVKLFDMPITGGAIINGVQHISGVATVKRTKTDTLEGTIVKDPKTRKEGVSFSSKSSDTPLEIKSEGSKEYVVEKGKRIYITRKGESVVVAKVENGTETVEIPVLIDVQNNKTVRSDINTKYPEILQYFGSFQQEEEQQEQDVPPVFNVRKIDQ